MIHRLSIILFCLLITSSCSRQNPTIEELYETMMGKEISFPKDLSYQNDSCDYTIVVAVDSVNCLSCNLKLNQWGEFINDITAKANARVNSIFVINTQRVAEIQRLWNKANSPLQYIIDSGNSLATENQIPSNNLFRSFLLDAAGKIVVIGNPLTNQNISELYYNEVGAEYVRKTNEKHIDLGYSTLGQKKHILFSQLNYSKEIWSVDSVYTSCECTHAEIDKNTIIPDDSLNITIEFTPDAVGDFYREIYVDFKEGRKQLLVSIEGTTIEE